MHTRTEKSSLNSEVNFYLQQLAETVPASTHASHKTTLQKFTEWYSDQSDYCDLDAESIAAFVATLYPNYPLTTIRGNIHTLSNFFAYLWKDDPSVVRLRIIARVEEETRAREKSDGICFHRALDSAGRSNEVVETLITYLRKHKFGTRLHVFVEILLDTLSQPLLVRRINMEDFDPGSRTIQIGIPETYAVSEAGLVENRLVSVSELTADALSTYINYERISVSGDLRPLLTTSHGRVSGSTLRRSTKQATNQAVTTDLPSMVTPSDIWQYAVTKTFDI